MRLLKRLLRPIYRAFFERPLWWFLSLLKAYFFAETLQRLENLERRVEQLANLEQRLNGLGPDIWHHLEANNAAQWDALEQLLLALFRQPVSRYDSFRENPAVPQWQPDAPTDIH